MKIIRGDLDDPRIAELLRVHVTSSAAQTEPGSEHALDSDGLRAPDIEFWAAWDGEDLLGFAALKALPDNHGEIKSMHVAQSQRRRGTGNALLNHLIGRAHAKGMSRVSLETGSWAYFRPAQTLYRKHGFVECAPYADYQPDRNSIFMTLNLRGANIPSG